MQVKDIWSAIFKYEKTSTYYLDFLRKQDKLRNSMHGNKIVKYAEVNF